MNYTFLIGMQKIKFRWVGRVAPPTMDLVDSTRLTASLWIGLLSAFGIELR